VYVVRQNHHGLWEVIDESDQPVFQGTKQQCEDWLDAAENSARAPQNGSLIAKLRQFFFGWN
jgi:hypothetical protein